MGRNYLEPQGFRSNALQNPVQLMRGVMWFPPAKMEFVLQIRPRSG